MKKPLLFAMIALLATSWAVEELQAQDTIKKPARVKFDPTRDAEKDISDAIKLARTTGKHIMLDVGGEWCIWCHRLDGFISSDEEISELLYTNYIVVKINYSKENKNEKVLSRYPQIKGYPHLFVLDKEGNLIHSQDTGALEAGKGYDREKMIHFLSQYAPGKQ